MVQSRCGSCFFLDAVNLLLQRPMVFGGFYLLFQVVYGAGKKTAGATGRVHNAFAQLRVDAVHHKAGDGSGRIEFTGVTGALQITKNLFVDNRQTGVVLWSR